MQLVASSKRVQTPANHWANENALETSSIIVGHTVSRGRYGKAQALVKSGLSPLQQF